MCQATKYLLEGSKQTPYTLLVSELFINSISIIHLNRYLSIILYKCNKDLSCNLSVNTVNVLKCLINYSILYIARSFQE